MPNRGNIPNKQGGHGGNQRRDNRQQQPQHAQQHWQQHQHPAQNMGQPVGNVGHPQMQNAPNQMPTSLHVHVPGHVPVFPNPPPSGPQQGMFTRRNTNQQVFYPYATHNQGPAGGQQYGYQNEYVPEQINGMVYYNLRPLPGPPQHQAHMVPQQGLQHPMPQYLPQPMQPFSPQLMPQLSPQAPLPQVPEVQVTPPPPPPSNFMKIGGVEVNTREVTQEDMKSKLNAQGTINENEWKNAVSNMKTLQLGVDSVRTKFNGLKKALDTMTIALTETGNEIVKINEDVESVTKKFESAWIANKQLQSDMVYTVSNPSLFLQQYQIRSPQQSLNTSMVPPQIQRRSPASRSPGTSQQAIVPMQRPDNTGIGPGVGRPVQPGPAPNAQPAAPASPAAQDAQSRPPTAPVARVAQPASPRVGQTASPAPAAQPVSPGQQGSEPYLAFAAQLAKSGPVVQVAQAAPVAQSSAQAPAGTATPAPAAQPGARAPAGTAKPAPATQPAHGKKQVPAASPAPAALPASSNQKTSTSSASKKVSTNSAAPSAQTGQKASPAKVATPAPTAQTSRGAPPAPVPEASSARQRGPAPQKQLAQRVRSAPVAQAISKAPPPPASRVTQSVPAAKPSSGNPAAQKTLPAPSAPPAPPILAASDFPTVQESLGTSKTFAAAAQKGLSAQQPQQRSQGVQRATTSKERSQKQSGNRRGNESQKEWITQTNKGRGRGFLAGRGESNKQSTQQAARKSPPNVEAPVQKTLETVPATSDVPPAPVVAVVQKTSAEKKVLAKQDAPATVPEAPKVSEPEVAPEITATPPSVSATQNVPEVKATAPTVQKAPLTRKDALPTEQEKQEQTAKVATKTDLGENTQEKSSEGKSIAKEPLKKTENVHHEVTQPKETVVESGSERPAEVELESKEQKETTSGTSSESHSKAAAEEQTSQSKKDVPFDEPNPKEDQEKQAQSSTSQRSENVKRKKEDNPQEDVAEDKSSSDENNKSDDETPDPPPNEPSSSGLPPVAANVIELTKKQKKNLKKKEAKAAGKAPFQPTVKNERIDLEKALSKERTKIKAIVGLYVEDQQLIRNLGTPEQFQPCCETYSVNWLRHDDFQLLPLDKMENFWKKVTEIPIVVQEDIEESLSKNRKSLLYKVLVDQKSDQVIQQDISRILTKVDDMNENRYVDFVLDYLETSRWKNIIKYVDRQLKPEEVSEKDAKEISEMETQIGEARKKDKKQFSFEYDSGFFKQRRRHYQEKADFSEKQAVNAMVYELLAKIAKGWNSHAERRIPYKGYGILGYDFYYLSQQFHENPATFEEKECAYCRIFVGKCSSF